MCRHVGRATIRYECFGDSVCHDTACLGPTSSGSEAGSTADGEAPTSVSGQGEPHHASPHGDRRSLSTEPGATQPSQVPAAKWLAEFGARWVVEGGMAFEQGRAMMKLRVVDATYRPEDLGRFLSIRHRGAVRGASEGRGWHLRVHPQSSYRTLVVCVVFGFTFSRIACGAA